tara:strand:+ start:391 stop:1098 length:708 start_codon:yes stop_codon:yes gene_type:complete
MICFLFNIKTNKGKFHLKIYLTILLLIVASFAIAENNEVTLEQEYTNLNNSILGGVIEFRCNNSFYKLEKSILTSNKVYIKNGIEWDLLSNVKLKQLGFSFIASNSIEQLDINLVNFENINLAIFNHKNVVTRTLAKDYFYLSHESVELPLLLTIDFKESKLLAKNVADFKAFLVFNKAMYIEEQGRVRILLDEETEKSNKLKRMILLEKSSEKYSTPMELTFPSNTLETQSYCY